MKKIYSLNIIAALGIALISCSKKDGNPNNNDVTSLPGTPAKMEVKFNAEPNVSPMAINFADEALIKKGLVFVFRGTTSDPVLDGKASFDFTSGISNPVSVNITAGTNRHVYVVANVPNVADFASVTKLSDLRNITNKYALSNTSSNNYLGASGFVENIDASAATTTSPATAAVTLNFLNSRVHLDWDVSAATTAFPGLAVSNVYMLNVKSHSDYFPATSGNLTTNVNTYLRGKSDITGFTGSYLPVSPATNTYNAALLMSDIVAMKGFANNAFYVFENNATAPTMAVIEATYNGNTYYYPVVINGSQNGSGAGGTTNAGNKSSSIVRGNIYYVNAIIKGLGNNDPYAPLIKGTINVTITAASWNPVINIDQEFN